MLIWISRREWKELKQSVIDINKRLGSYPILICPDKSILMHGYSVRRVDLSSAIQLIIEHLKLKFKYLDSVPEKIILENK